MAKKGYLDFIKSVLPYATTMKDLLGEAGFRSGLEATGGSIIEQNMPKKVSINSNTEAKGWFKDEGALVYPQNLFSPGNEAYIFFIMRDSNLQSTAVYKRIGLYMPPGIKVNYGSNWEELNMTVAQSFDAASNAFGAAQDMFSSDPSAQQRAEENLARAGAGGVAKILEKVSDDSSIGQQLEVVSRKTTNPHQALLFKSISFREFEFSFEFLARTREESDAIRQIIKVFKWGMHPGGSASSTYWDYPNTFDIYLLTPNHKYMFNISQSVLTNVDLDYGGSGAASFFKETGAPVHINMSLRFKELSVLTKELIEKDY